MSKIANVKLDAELFLEIINLSPFERLEITANSIDADGNQQARKMTLLRGDERMWNEEFRGYEVVGVEAVSAGVFKIELSNLPEYE